MKRIIDKLFLVLMLLVFMGVSLSITAFPVLARILVELKLLATTIGETAMAAAAFNDIAAWVLLALAVALSGGGHHKSPLISSWVLLCGVAFVAFEMIVVKPAMAWIGRRAEEARRAMFSHSNATFIFNRLYSSELCMPHQLIKASQYVVYP